MGVESEASVVVQFAASEGTVLVVCTVSLISLVLEELSAAIDVDSGSFGDFPISLREDGLLVPAWHRLRVVLESAHGVELLDILSS